MITANPVLKRGRMVWDQTKMLRADFEQRILKLQTAMVSKKLDLLLVYGDICDYGNMCWLSGYVPKRGWAIVAVPSQGEPILVCGHGSRELYFTKTITWIEDIRAAESLPNLGVNIQSIVKDKVSLNGCVGVDGVRDQASYGLWQTITAQLDNYKIITANTLVSELRRVKSPLEIRCIKDAADTLAAVVSGFKSLSLTGMLEYELRARLDFWAREQGAEDVRILFGKPGNNQNLYLPSEAPLQAGTWLQCYLAVAKDRYWSDTAFCITVGAEDPALAELQAKIAQREENLAKQCRPGVLVANLAQMILQENEKTAPRAAYLYGLGSGIGLNIEEQPYVHQENNGALIADTVLSLNLLQGYQEKTCLYKTTLLITDQGCQSINIR